MSLTPNTAGMAPAEAAAWPNATTTAPAPSAGLKHPGLVSLINACDIHLPSGQKLALIALARCRDAHTGRSMISFKAIGRRSGFGDRQASRHVEALMGLGLVSRVGKVGQCYVYTINTQALAQADTRQGSTVDNPGGTPDIGDTDPGHFEQPPLTFLTATPVMDVHCSGGYSGFYSEGESEARAPAAEPLEPVFPPLPVFEDPKPEQPARVAVNDVLTGIAGMQAEALPLIAEAVNRLIEAQEAGKAPQRRLVAHVASALCAPQDPTASATTAQPASPAPTAPASATAPAIDPAQLATLNARRTAGGKSALTPRDLHDLAAVAVEAGRTLGNLVELINARGWLFARADWKGVKVDAAPAVVPSEPTPQARAAAEAHAARLRAIDGTGTPASAATVAACMARLRTAPLAMGSTGTGWARAAVDRFVSGQDVAHAAISAAAAALKLSLADLKAQRAANLQRDEVAA